MNSSKKTIVRTTKFRALDQSKTGVIHYRKKRTFAGLGQNINMTKTARLDEMEHEGKHVPTHKPVGVCGNKMVKLKLIQLMLARRDRFAFTRRTFLFVSFSFGVLASFPSINCAVSVDIPS